jgi:hypothetical protein
VKIAWAHGHVETVKLAGNAHVDLKR